LRILQTIGGVPRVLNDEIPLRKFNVRTLSPSRDSVSVVVFAYATTSCRLHDPHIFFVCCTPTPLAYATSHLNTTFTVPHPCHPRFEGNTAYCNSHSRISLSANYSAVLRSPGVIQKHACRIWHKNIKSLDFVSRIRLCFFSPFHDSDCIQQELAAFSFLLYMIMMR